MNKKSIMLFKKNYNNFELLALNYIDILVSIFKNHNHTIQAHKVYSLPKR
jgi:hypothetical protein